MRRIAHISDLHFGCNDPLATQALLDDIAEQQPHLVAVSGDLTQRAHHHEFASARAFLDHIDAPIIAVPGNHDVPLYNVARRAFTPLKRFRHYISAEPHPFFADGELAVLGINTARSATLSNGRISHEQMAAISSVFGQVPSTRFRSLITHHPLMPPPDAPDRDIVGRADPALRAIAAAGVDLLLAGHYHRAFTGDIASYHLAARRSILVSQAGTAISTRRRDEVNSYNFISINDREISCRRRIWDGGRFAEGTAQHYALVGRHWLPRGNGPGGTEAQV
jgi:3',5'-cyclic AMP phosphodiesterase CpdA